MQTPSVIRVYGPDGEAPVTYRPAYNTFTMSPWDDAVAWVDPAGVENGTVPVFDIVTAALAAR